MGLCERGSDSLPQLRLVPIGRPLIGATLGESVEVDPLLVTLASAAAPSAVAPGKTLWLVLSVAVEIVVSLG